MMGFIFAVCIFLLVIGTFTDLKTREVPDWVNYSGIFAGLGIRLIWSFYSFDWSFIIEGLFGFGVFFGMACAMFYLGQWGGGDAKMLMALGALLGLRFSLDSFAVGFVINLMIAGGLYGLVWSAVLAVLNHKRFFAEFCRYRDLQVKWRSLFLGFAVVLFVYAVFAASGFVRFLFFFCALMVPVMFYVLCAVRAVENACMYKKLKPSELTEGDWIAKDVVVKNRRICGPKDLGIDKKQIMQLVALKVQSVVVKTGIPFVPSFLIAFLLTLWIGNPLLLLL